MLKCNKNKSSSKRNQLLLFERKNEAYEALNFFRDTEKTEGAFYLRFQVMPEEKLKILKRFYKKEEDWQIFKLICLFWNVTE
jgi:hypothetical protein